MVSGKRLCGSEGKRRRGDVCGYSNGEEGGKEERLWRMHVEGLDRYGIPMRY